MEDEDKAVKIALSWIDPLGLSLALVMLASFEFF